MTLAFAFLVLSPTKKMKVRQTAAATHNVFGAKDLRGQKLQNGHAMMRIPVSAPMSIDMLARHAYAPNIYVPSSRMPSSLRVGFAPYIPPTSASHGERVGRYAPFGSIEQVVASSVNGSQAMGYPQTMSPRIVMAERAAEQSQKEKARVVA